MTENLKRAPLTKPTAAWGGLELLGVDIWPDRVQAGGVVQVTYRWVRRKPSAQDASDMVIAMFIDPKGEYWMKNDAFWLHDIHPVPTGLPTQMKPGLLYEDRRLLMVPSDYPPGNYALAVGLQKQAPVREEGKEPFAKEFYERNSFQSLDKFMGQGENGAVVQFSAGASGDWKEGLWPVTKSLYPIADPRFVPVAELQINHPN